MANKKAKQGLKNSKAGSRRATVGALDSQQYQTAYNNHNNKSIY